MGTQKCPDKPHSIHLHITSLKVQLKHHKVILRDMSLGLKLWDKRAWESLSHNSTSKSKGREVGIQVIGIGNMGLTIKQSSPRISKRQVHITQAMGVRN